MNTFLRTALRWLTVATTLIAAAPAFAQQIYATPDEAASAFVDALARSDTDALRIVLGPDYREVLPLDQVNPDDVTQFLSDAAQRQTLMWQGDDQAELSVGAEGWTLPIPIVKAGNGWRFDTHAGAQEMITRRIGGNELAAMQALLAYYDAQKDYALVDHNGDGVLEYAQRFFSRPGKHDGLYWKTASGNDESPLGPYFAGKTAGKGPGYYGYHFKILAGQGPHANGGARSYVIGARMRAGFAAVAWPVRYGQTGIMSFIVNHEGQVYQKDLGPKSDALARGMTLFDPDSGWQKVDVPPL